MMDLTIDDLLWAEEQLKRFTYKRGWEWRLIDPVTQYDDAGIHIQFHTENSYRPDKLILIKSRDRLPTQILVKRDEDKFARYLLDVLLRVERHEAQEWLKRDGVVLFDPHK